MAANTNRALIVPTTEEQTVAPSMARRRPYAALRSREHLTLDEVERLIDAAKQGRWGHRDATMLLVTYRHGLRASELTDLHWDQVDFSTANLHVRRAKKGSPATHPILGDELRALRRLRREQAPSRPSSSPVSAAAHSPPPASHASLRPSHSARGACGPWWFIGTLIGTRPLSSRRYENGRAIDPKNKNANKIGPNGTGRDMPGQ